MLDFFEHRVVRTIGLVLFAGLLGFAAGNSHVTTETLAGDDVWWQKYCHAQVVQQLQRHQQQDIKKYGW